MYSTPYWSWPPRSIVQLTWPSAHDLICKGRQCTCWNQKGMCAVKELNSGIHKRNTHSIRAILELHGSIQNHFGTKLKLKALKLLALFTTQIRKTPHKTVVQETLHAESYGLPLKHRRILLRRADEYQGNDKATGHLSALVPHSRGRPFECS